MKIYRIINKKGFRFRNIFIFFNDKTLGFVLFYSIFLGLSFGLVGFLSLLMFDYFFRFKISSKITFLMFRSIPKIFYLTILLFTVLYIIALLAISQEVRTDECVDVAGCTQDIFYIFMELRFNLKLPYSEQSIL